MAIYCVPAGPVVAGEPLCVPVETRPAAGPGITDKSFDTDNPIKQAPTLIDPAPPPVIEVFQ